MRPRTLFALVALAFAAPVSAQTFTERPDLVHVAPPAPRLVIGASAADVNNDGLVDLYHPGRLLLNEGERGFTDLRTELGLVDEGEFVFGAIFGDYDGDAWLDAFMEDITPPAFLFRNEGGRFVRADAAAGLQTEGLLTQGSAWSDFNGDGRLDLFAGGDDGVSRLFVNTGNGRFAAPALITYERNVYGVVATDYDRDGDVDLFLAPCHPSDINRSVNVLLRNDGRGAFVDVAQAAGVAENSDSWGVTAADVDNDGWFDLYVGNFPRPSSNRPGTNRLFRNNRNGTFTDVSVAASVGGPDDAYTYSVAAADFDNDGWIDLYAMSRPLGLRPDTTVRHQLFRNNGDGTFTDVARAAGIDTRVSAGAVADFDGDGWVDVFATGEDYEDEAADGTEPNRVFLNDGGANHWLVVHLRQPGDNHYGVGARVEVWAGGMVRVREIVAGDGFTSQSHALRAHVGLGAAASADSVVVYWPGGGVDRLYDVAADREVTVARGRGLDAPPARFALVAPADGAAPGTGPVTLSWEPAPDPDRDRVTYTVYLHGPGGTQALDAGASTQLALPALSGDPMTWSVAATDGTSVRGSLGRPWRLNPARTSTEPDPLPARPALTVFPSPARGPVQVRLGLTAPARVRAVLYDLLGRAVTVLDAGEHPSGGQWTLETQGLPAGVYVLRVEGPSGVATRPVVVLR